MKTPIIPILTICLVFIGIGARPAESFKCWSDGRLLPDAELIQGAMDREADYGLPEPLRNLGAAGLIAKAPDCCFVQRADNPFNENRTWVSRLLSRPTILVTINWAKVSKTSKVAIAYYTMSLCGEVLERHGHDRR